MSRDAPLMTPSVAVRRRHLPRRRGGEAQRIGPIVLVIFDCDGVLVDSEPLANASFSRALKPHGLDWSVEETMRRLMGRSLKSCVEIVEAEIGGKLPDDFVDRMQVVTYQSFRDAPLQPVAGVKEAVLALQAAGLATCVASSGSLEKMRFTLGLTGLWDLFEGRIFSASQVKRGKPFPDLFLHAAIAMDEQPFNCVVIEDSVPGVQAARSAGMRPFAYAGAPYADRDGLSAAGGFLFGDMKQLPELVLECR
jgi:HAD superfamily hydrolase (TIGR01509 family)